MHYNSFAAQHYFIFKISLSFLIAFHTGINVLHKYQTELEPGSSEHKEEAEGHNCHVSEVEGRLQNTCHSTSMKIVVERVDVDEDTGHSSINVGGPPPSMIFACELEIK